jgi:hypothetical protein
MAMKYVFTTKAANLTVHTKYGPCHFLGGRYETDNEKKAAEVRKSPNCNEQRAIKSEKAATSGATVTPKTPEAGNKAPAAPRPLPKDTPPKK